MPKLIFRGASVRYFDTRMSQGGESVFVRVHVGADFTDVVRSAMEWQELPDAFTEGKLSGEMVAQKISMKGEKGLGIAFEMAAKSLSSFSVVTVKEENSSHRELRFVIVTDEAGAFSTMGNFIVAAGKAKCQLTVHYSEQATLVPDDVQAPDQQGVLEEV